MKPDYSHLVGKRLLALDYGRKRIGVAVADQFHVTVSARGVVDREAPSVWDELSKLAKSEGVAAIVLGLPIRHDEQESEMTNEIRSFAADLEDKLGLAVILHDEAFSSRSAVKHLIATGVKKKARRTKGVVDTVAAVLILRDFIGEYLSNSRSAVERMTLDGPSDTSI